MHRKILHRIAASLAVALIIATAAGCRHDQIIDDAGQDSAGEEQTSAITGFYLLNEGNMGSNKSTLDYYDYTSATYTRNIYGTANPDVPKELGDVGNDLKIYRGRLYAVINCSNKVEVMDVATARRIAKIDIPNCRYIAFDGDYAYVTSYAGPVEIKPDYEQKGYVAKIDLNTFQITDRCIVGFQPDELCVLGGKIYVANSGGYMVPNYENTVSVIDIATFKETERIPIAINLHRIRADREGRLWISSRGDYYTTESHLYCYDPAAGKLLKTFDVPVSNMDICGDRLYAVSAQWSYVTMSNSVTSAIVNTSTLEKETDSFITDGTEKEIKIPYGIRVNPATGEILVTDARNYVNPGYLHCYSPEGVLKWSVRTGDIPAHIAFTTETTEREK